MPRIKKKEILFLFIIALVILLAIGIIGEVYLRTEHNKAREQIAKKYAEYEICYIKSNNTALIYELAPNKCGSNSHGFLDYEHNYTKEKGVFRIVVIGDSIAQGYELNSFKESFPKILEKKLNNNPKNNMKFEIIVLAVSGYSASQELVLLEKALRYNPNLIIWSYCLNDPDPHADAERSIYFFKPKSYALYFFASKLSSIKEKIIAKIKNCSSQEYYSFLHCVYQGEIKNDLKKIGRLSQEKQVSVIFLINPILEQNKSFDNYSLQGLHENLSYEASKDGLIVYDLLKAYQNYSSKELGRGIDSRGWYDPWHPNAKGHELIADYLYDNIIWSGKK